MNYFLIEFGSDVETWVGVVRRTKKEDFRWVISGKVFPGYLNPNDIPANIWRNGDPNETGEEACVRVKTADVILADTSCNDQCTYLCEIPNY